jgi:hypothetical protein
MSELSPLCAEQRTLEFGSEHSRRIDGDTARGVTAAQMPAAVPAGVAEQGIEAKAIRERGTAPPEELGTSGAVRAMKRQS